MTKVKLAGSYGSFRRMTAAEQAAKGLRGRQYIDDSGKIIPVSQFQKLARSHQGLPQAPSRQPKQTKVVAQPQPTVRKTTVVGKLLSQKPKPISNRLSRYNTRVKAYAQNNSMMIKDVKKDKIFQSLNKGVASELKQMDALEVRLEKLVDKHNLGNIKGGLTESKYQQLIDAIDKSSLTQKENKVILDLMDKIRNKRDRLGDKFRALGMKDNNDYSALGDTPKV